MISKVTFLLDWCLRIALVSQTHFLYAQRAAPFTNCPAEFREADPQLRSPLLFDDGTEVKNTQDWLRRREEIKANWQALMGTWPPLIERPSIEWGERTQREAISHQRLRLQIAPNRFADGILLTPLGEGPFPAAFVPFYDPETSVGLSDKPHRDLAWQLAQRGFVSLAIGSPGGDAYQPDLDETAHCQPLSYLAYVSANIWNAMASMKSVDPGRIAIVGHSYGGKWAMFGSCLWDKYACAVWSDPGIVFDESRTSINYQEPWYLGRDPTVTRKRGLVRDDSPRTGAYKKLVERGYNLHELHALMAPRPFLVSGGAEDPPKRWSALGHAIAVNQLLGFNDRVSMTNRETHAPTAESNRQIVDFMVYWLKP
jgi:hypothetical protein